MTTDNQDTPGDHTPPPAPPEKSTRPEQHPVTAEPYAAQPGSGYPTSTTPGYGAPGHPTAPTTNTLSIVSLVTGFFCGIAAVITGHIALAQIKRTGEGGRGLAIAGLVLGYVGVCLTMLAVIFSIVFAASLGAFFASISGPSVSSVPAPIVASGTVGAAHLDEGYLQVGTGRTVVDVYIDPMCPYCGQFDVANGDGLAELVDSNSISLRVHPLTFLDGASQGTAYSSRASAALTCEAAINPGSTLDYLSALYVAQPAEGTSGLTDDELAELSTNADSIRDCIDGGDYLAWAQRNTERALTGPIEGAEISSIQGTPTVLVDGRQYTGPIDNPQALSEFILGQVS